MHLSRSLLILFVTLVTLHSVASRGGRALWDFSNMISCTVPGPIPVIRFGDYGCYCGYGGSGRPVDALDRCCQVHDNCYGQATRRPDCQGIFDSPYIKPYSFTCARRTPTCSSKNSSCAQFICECDRNAAMCFASTPYRRRLINLISSRYCN
ncbi:phospholipase A2, minor isoenzyme-like [Genypterus blacodes]|uniref:phospholipase A2, minor isoenzyme-like n=1 Tax=Genypterus blacodes TaxID=154954 RepID=UPI003F7633F6